MRLKTLTIRNFQSHKKTELNFHPGINVIYGDSNHGKTALFRAFQWLSINRPLGFRFRSWFAGKKEPTQVTVVTDRDTITRTRHEKGKSTYDINGSLYKGFDKDVPDEVTKALNLSELNVQPQLEPFFLVTSSPGEITKTINRIIKIEKTDDWIKKLTTRINTCRAEKRVLKSELEVVKDDLEGIGDLTEAEDKINRAEKKLNVLKKMSAEHYNLIRFVEDYEEINIELKRIAKTLEKKKALDDFDTMEIHLIIEEINNLKQFEEEKFIMEKKIKQQEAAKETFRQDIENMLLELGQCPVCFSDIETEDIDRIMERL